MQNEPENEYPIEWLIDYVHVYKDKNGYDENNRLQCDEVFSIISTKHNPTPI